MYRAWTILFSTLYIAQGFLLLSHKLKLLPVRQASSQPSVGGPQPILWEQDKKGSVRTLSIGSLSQEKGLSSEKNSKQCFFDHSDPCPTSRGGRCHVDGRPCVAQRSYLPPKTFKKPEDLSVEKERSHKDTTALSARFDAFHDDFLERAERALRSETNTYSDNRGRIEKKYKKLSPRPVKRIDEEARAFVKEPEVATSGNSYLITNSGVVMVDWQRIKSDLMPVHTTNVFAGATKVIAEMAGKIRNLVFQAFLRQ